MVETRGKSMRAEDVQRDTGAAGKMVAIVVGGVLLVALVVALAVGNLLNSGDDDVLPQDEVTDVTEGALPPEVYRGITVGIDKEALTERVLPVRPVDSAVLDRYQTRSPEGIESSCVYYKAQGGDPDDLFRFCFEDDRLVDKSVVVPDEG
jgi:hypothetical protein